MCAWVSPIRWAAGPPPPPPLGPAPPIPRLPPPAPPHHPPPAPPRLAAAAPPSPPPARARAAPPRRPLRIPPPGPRGRPSLRFRRSGRLGRLPSPHSPLRHPPARAPSRSAPPAARAALSVPPISLRGAPARLPGRFASRRLPPRPHQPHPPPLLRLSLRSSGRRSPAPRPGAPPPRTPRPLCLHPRPPPGPSGPLFLPRLRAAALSGAGPARIPRRAPARRGGGRGAARGACAAGSGCGGRAPGGPARRQGAPAPPRPRLVSGRCLVRALGWVSRPCRAAGSPCCRPCVIWCARAAPGRGGPPGRPGAPARVRMRDRHTSASAASDCSLPCRVSRMPTMYCTWVLSAPPLPTTAFLMWRGAYSLTGRPALTQAQIAAPRAWPSFRADCGFFDRNTVSTAASSGLNSAMAAGNAVEDVLQAQREGLIRCLHDAVMHMLELPAQRGDQADAGAPRAGVDAEDADAHFDVPKRECASGWMWVGSLALLRELGSRRARAPAELLVGSDLVRTLLRRRRESVRTGPDPRNQGRQGASEDVICPCFVF